MTAAVVADAVFLEEAFRIIDEAQKQGMPLRLLGSVAIKLHCPQNRHLYEAANRPLTDLDFMTYSRFNPRMHDFFTSMGYIPNESVIRYFGRYRHIYWSEEKLLQADIFFDKLSFCHDVDFRGRLELDSPTITVTDMLLQKMQIVQINEKDLKDTVVLLREHELGANDIDRIDDGYIADIMASDWGFYYTFVTNVNKVCLYLEELSVLSHEDRQVVFHRAQALIAVIEERPKSAKWKLRSKVGTKKRWYNEVEEVAR